MNNTGVVFLRTVRDSWLGILAWGIGLGLLTLSVIVAYPTITSAFEGYAEILENPLAQAFLGDSADSAAFATPEGYFAIYVMAFTPLYIAVYLVLMGLGVTASEEERGTIEVLLSTPIPRWQLIVEKFLALVLIISLILILHGLVAFIGLIMTPQMELSLGRLVEGSIGMLPIMVVIAVMALFFSTLVRSRMIAGGIVGAMIVGSYLITNLASVAPDALEKIKYVSFFTYYPSMAIMQNGIVWSDWLIMSALSIILLGLSLLAFQRRDLVL